MKLQYFHTNAPPLPGAYLHHKFPVTSSSTPRKLTPPLSHSPSSDKIISKPVTSKQFSKKHLPLHSLLKTLNSSPVQSQNLNLLLPELSPKEQTLILKAQHNYQNALLLFNHFKSQPGYQPNPIHYNVLFRILGRARKWDELRVYWIKMAKDDILPTNNTYATLIDVFSKAGLIKESFLWLKHMKSRGIFPDEVSMNTVVKILKDKGKFDVGERFFRSWCDGKFEFDEIIGIDFGGDEDDYGISFKQFLLTEMFKSGSRVSISKNGVDLKPNKPKLAATYNTLIDLYGKAGKLQNASDCFKDMLINGVEPDVYTFNTMVNICGAIGNLSEAKSLLQKMEERRIKPDVKTYNVFMSLYSNNSDIDGVLRFYSKISDGGLRPDAVSYRIILQVLCKKKMVFEVENVIKDIMVSDASVDEQCLPIILKMYVENGLLHEAKTFFEKHCFGREMSSRNYAAIIDAYAEKGHWKEAEDVFLAKRSEGTKKYVVEYNVMIKAYGKAKLYDKAITLFESMRAYGVWPDECTYNSIVQMLCAAEFPDRARYFLKKMKESGLRPRCETYSAIIHCYCKMNAMHDALEVFHDMKISDIIPNEVVYGSLVDGFAETSNIEDTLKYLKLMEASGFPANKIVLTSLIKAYSKSGCWKEAQEVYVEVKKLENGPDTIASNCMLNLYANLGMVTEAKLIFDDLRRNNTADSISYSTMMFLYKNMGLLDEATDIAQNAQISGLLTDCDSYNNVMASYATHGKLKECVELLHQMLKRRILPNAMTFKTLFTILKKGGLADEAVLQLESSYIDGKPFARQAVITSVFSVMDFHSFAIKSCEAILKEEVPIEKFAYNVAIFAYGNADEVDKALNIFMKMQDEGLEPDIVTYIYLATCYGKAGMIEGLKRIYGLLKYGEMEPNHSLYKVLINAYRIAGKEDLAKMVDQEMRFSVYSEDVSESDSEFDD